MNPVQKNAWLPSFAAIAMLILSLFIASPVSAQTCLTNCLRVYSIQLTDLGTSIRGIVKLTDETYSGAGARNTTVHAIWTRPDGSALDQYRRIGTRLRAEFRLYTSGMAGTYTLTVLDATKPDYTFDPENSTLLSETITIGQPQNLAPAAVPNANVTSGPLPLTVNFDASGSSDPDGTIVDYAWDFGDGNASAEQNPTHIYTSPGTFIAGLTVTDDQGATSSSSIQITTTEYTANCDSQCITVDRMEFRFSNRYKLLKGLVWIDDENSKRLVNAVIHTVWTLPDGTTIEQFKDIETAARAKFTIEAKQAGTYTLTVVDVVKAGYTFDAVASQVLEQTITLEP